jgi:hypothetical protein
MKTVVNRLRVSVTLILSAFALGFTPSVLVATMIALFTRASFYDCSETAMFWVIGVIGTFVAGAALAAELDFDDNDNDNN